MSMKQWMQSAGAGIACAAALLAPAQPGQAVPSGYWEGKASAHEVPMKDPNKELTRSVEADIWFTVRWDPRTQTGTVAGEADAKYDSVLKVENLPKVSAPTPHGGTIKFEPSVGGKLGEDNKRKFPIVGVIALGQDGRGTLYLRKVDDRPQGTQSQRLDAEARGARSYDAPMEFVMRADPGVSGGISGRAGSVSSSGGTISGSAGGLSQDVNTGRDGPGVIVQKIPMTPFSPFTEAPGSVTKRPDGPFAVSFEETSARRTIRWNARQMGGEKRQPIAMTPEMQRIVDEILRQLSNQRR